MISYIKTLKDVDTERSRIHKQTNIEQFIHDIVP